MPKLPTLNYKELIKICTSFGYSIARQKGSHIQMIHPKRPRITIPAHSTIFKGTLKKIMNAAGITVDELIEKR